MELGSMLSSFNLVRGSRSPAPLERLPTTTVGERRGSPPNCRLLCTIHHVDAEAGVRPDGRSIRNEKGLTQGLIRFRSPLDRNEVPPAADPVFASSLDCRMHG